MRQRTAYVHLAYGLDAVKYRERYRDGLVPDETPYGFHHAEQMGWHVVFSTDYPISGLENFVRRALLWTIGFDIIHAYRNRRQVQEADVVWTMEEVQYLAICALPFLIPRMRRPRLIAQTVWLFNRWGIYSSIRRWFLRYLLRRADVLTVHSNQYLELIPKCVPGMTGELLYFGISLDSFPWTQREVVLRRPIRILSMGGDRTREWTTLLKALGNDDRFEVQVICTWLSDEEVAPYSNVMTPRNPSMNEFRALYQWADIVVLPMLPNLYSGITVALEATCRGVPLISSQTGGVPTYFSEDEVLYIPPLNPEALRDAVLSYDSAKLSDLVSRAQGRFKQEDYSTRGMARRYVNLSERILAVETMKR